ncbi:MAG TPA: SURF1 family protein [Candidatus Sulfotelmatobacter sp.]|nr:SURF1 family protein [Candidatus Sulfotelmatobacter sp.]
MNVRSAAAALLVVAGTAVCWRLGFWQISRLHEKQALNAALRAALAAPPIEAGDRPLPLARARDRRVSFHGRFDLAHQVLLSGRAQGGSPGVDVVTPLVLAGDTAAVLVDRGWLYSADAATVPVDLIPGDSGRAVVGLAQAPARGGAYPPLRSIGTASAQVWSVPRLDPDSLRGRVPYALAPYVLRELPGPGVPEHPLRTDPRPFDEIMHVSYAIQWFLFGSILLFGSLLLARSRRSGAGRTVARLDEEAPPAHDGAR